MSIFLQLIVICLLVVQDLRDLRIHVDELVVRLPIIQVDQHVA